jgi:hypothetical protein
VHIKLSTKCILLSNVKLRGNTAGGLKRNKEFTCPDCAQNAWAKPDALLICGACYEDGDGDIRLMLAEPSEEADAA